MSLGSQGAKAGWGGADGQGLSRPRWVIKGEEASVVKKVGRGEGRGDKDKRSLFLFEGRGPLEEVG